MITANTMIAIKAMNANHPIIPIRCLVGPSVLRTPVDFRFLRGFFFFLRDIGTNSTQFNSFRKLENQFIGFDHTHFVPRNALDRLRVIAQASNLAL